MERKDQQNNSINGHRWGMSLSNIFPILRYKEEISVLDPKAEIGDYLDVTCRIKNEL